MTPELHSLLSMRFHEAEYEARWANIASKMGQPSPKMVAENLGFLFVFPRFFAFPLCLGQHRGKIGRHMSKMGQQKVKVGQHRAQIGQT